MLNMILIYFRNRRISLLAFLILPLVFLAIGDLNLLFISYVTCITSFIFMFDNFTYSLALPISRKNIVRGNYLAYIILVITNISYLLALVHLAKRCYNLETDGSFSLLGVLYSIDILAIFSIHIPISIRDKVKSNYKLINRFPVISIIFILVISHYEDSLEAINIIYHLVFTIITVGFFFFIGYRNSLKNIEKIDF